MIHTCSAVVPLALHAEEALKLEYTQCSVVSEGRCEIGITLSFQSPQSWPRIAKMPLKHRYHNLPLRVHNTGRGQVYLNLKKMLLNAKR